MDANAFWISSHMQLPLLFIIANNQGATTMAQSRDRALFARGRARLRGVGIPFMGTRVSGAALKLAIAVVEGGGRYFLDV